MEVSLLQIVCVPLSFKKSSTFHNICITKIIRKEMEKVPRQCGDKGLKSLQWSNTVVSHLCNSIVIYLFDSSNSKRSAKIEVMSQLIKVDQIKID